jgi:hypothetical protein
MRDVGLLTHDVTTLIHQAHAGVVGGGGACRADGYDAVFQGLRSSSTSPILMTRTPPDRFADAGQVRLQLWSVLSGLQPF